MKKPIIVTGEKVIEPFLEFCTDKEVEHLFLISDENTYEILGKEIAKKTRSAGFGLLDLVLSPEKLHNDDHSIAKVLSVYDAVPRLFISVGSGTVTDIARFTSHRTQNQFVSFPTAASVDAYTSRIAPTTIGGYKKSYPCSMPLAIFTHVPTICEAPKFLTASGFGDLMGKFTSSADWKLTNLIWGSELNENIYARTLGAGEKARENAYGIARQQPGAMEAMMEAHFETGLCMAEFGRSDPASGGEHHISHIWEMIFQWEEKEGLFHGSAVGVASLIEAGWYEKLRKLSKTEAEEHLERVPVPTADVQKLRIRNALPKIAEELIASEPFYLQLADSKIHKKVCLNILDKWEEIQEAASHVPSQHELRLLLEQVGGAVSGEDLGLTEEQVKIGKDFGHYLRERFSINLLRKLFGW